MNWTFMACYIQAMTGCLDSQFCIKFAAECIGPHDSRSTKTKHLPAIIVAWRIQEILVSKNTAGTCELLTSAFSKWSLSVYIIWPSSRHVCSHCTDQSQNFKLFTVPVSISLITIVDGLSQPFGAEVLLQAFSFDVCFVCSKPKRERESNHVTES